MEQQQRVQFLQDIVKINTVGGNEKEVADYLQAALAPCGAQCEQVEYAEGRNQLIATLCFGNPGKTLGFSGHMDVVPVGDAPWEYPPFDATVTGGRLHGRGATDMKGGLAAMAIALIELAQSKAPLNGRIKLIATVGEETAAIGSAQLVKLGYANDLDALIIGEPSGLTIGAAHKGALWVRFTTHGKTAHASMPQLGVNAINNMLTLVARFKQTFSFADWTPDGQPMDGLDASQMRAPTASLTVLNGGKATNVIPDKCTAEFDMRTMPGQDHAQILAQMNAMLAALAKENENFTAELEVINNQPPLLTSPQEPFVRLAVEQTAKVTGQTPVVAGLSAYTDASQFGQAEKTYPIIILGPGPGELSHQPNEYVDLGLFEKTIEVYKNIAMEYLK